MGEVYRAHDTKLGRDVALKVLPPAFLSDSTRTALFQREAEALASLNYSGIAAIYGLQESDGVRALILELVDGPTLAETAHRFRLVGKGHSRYCHPLVVPRKWAVKETGENGGDL